VCVFVLFIGTWFSNLYTAVDTPHEPEPRYVHDVSVFVCKGVFGSCKASQPPNIRKERKRQRVGVSKMKGQQDVGQEML
jgi:hypothetical protein